MTQVLNSAALLLNRCGSVLTLNDAIHISEDSGLTMGMAVYSVGVWRAALKLSGMFGLLVVKHTLQLCSAAHCWSFCFTATLGLVFQATLLQGNYLQRAHQRQIRWEQPWWCRRMTGRCWCPGRPPACRGHSGSQTLWSYRQENREKHSYHADH